ncbi:tenascin-like isoform X2 [Rhipicephalus microplus]|uniref:tenascin-like isoform X2 n=1 Tax=Rhipicephalus microplus TaxID=6941 RepID=UPI003F6C4D9D
MVADLFRHTDCSTVVFALLLSSLGQVFETSAENKQDGESDIVKVTVRSIMGTSITTSWSRPEYQFDFYRLEMTEDKLDANGRTYRANLGSCGISKYARNETVTSCGDFEGCTHVNLEIFAQSHGPPESARLVSGIEGIFVPGQDPDSPSNLTMVEISSTTTRLHWEPPVKVHGRFHGYTIKKCEKFTSCERGENMHACSESHTLEEWLDINNYVNSELCVLVTARARCGSQTLSSRPLVGKLTNISFVVPKVANVTLIDDGPDYFTVSWTKPAVSFDYYWVEVLYIGDESDMLTPHRVGSCANGTAVHRSQTQITCDKFKACANITFTMHAHVETASQLTFPGTTLRGIFLPGKDLPEVRQLKLTEMDKDSITVSWQRPEGCFDGYIVEVAQESSGSSGGGGLSAGSCAGGVTVDAQQTSITCRKIKACSVKITVRTQRKGHLKFTSPGVTLNNVVMYKKDIPEVLPTLQVANDTFVLRWNRPTGCFDKYNLEVAYEPYKYSTFETPRIGSCAGTTVLEPDVTNVTCSHLPACVNTSVILRTQRNGPHGRVSRAEALFVYSETGALPQHRVASRSENWLTSISFLLQSSSSSFFSG